MRPGSPSSSALSTTAAAPHSGLAKSAKNTMVTGAVSGPRRGEAGASCTACAPTGPAPSRACLPTSCPTGTWAAAACPAASASTDAAATHRRSADASLSHCPTQLRMTGSSIFGSLRTPLIVHRGSAVANGDQRRRALQAERLPRRVSRVGVPGERGRLRGPHAVDVGARVRERRAHDHDDPARRVLDLPPGQRVEEIVARLVAGRDVDEQPVPAAATVRGSRRPRRREPRPRTAAMAPARQPRPRRLRARWPHRTPRPGVSPA